MNTASELLDLQCPAVTCASNTERGPAGVLQMGSAPLTRDGNAGEEKGTSAYLEWQEKAAQITELQPDIKGISQTQPSGLGPRAWPAAYMVWSDGHL